jgi:hypothetical protein
MDIVMAHCGPGAFDQPDEAKALGVELRALVPGVRLWWGVGVDGLVNQLAHGTPRATIQHQLEGLARNAKAQSIELVMWDQEGKGEAYPEPAAIVARMAIETLRTIAPGIKQGFTSYDHPCAVPVNAAGYPAAPGEAVVRHFGGHGRLPWDPWLDNDLGAGVDLNAEQTYVADNPAAPAAPGSLRRRQATSNASFALLERAGRMRPGMPRVHYNQLWGVAGPQTVNAELGSHLWCGWAAPVGGRCDLNGRLEVLTACELRRRGVRDGGGAQVPAAPARGATPTASSWARDRARLGIRAADWA